MKNTYRYLAFTKDNPQWIRMEKNEKEVEVVTDINTYGSVVCERSPTPPYTVLHLVSLTRKEYLTNRIRLQSYPNHKKFK